jgi:hypothetical protein
MRNDNNNKKNHYLKLLLVCFLKCVVHRGDFFFSFSFLKESILVSFIEIISTNLLQATITKVTRL